MNAEAWKDFPGAPVPGTVICAEDQLPQQGVKGIDLAGFPLLLVASVDGLRAFVNACPHQYLPLDWRGAGLLSADGQTLRCSNHGWGFDAETGQGVDGGAEGCALDPVPVTLRDGQLFIGD